MRIRRFLGLMITVLLLALAAVACGQNSSKKENGKKRDGLTKVQDGPSATPTEAVPTFAPIPTPEPIELYEFTYETPNKALIAFAEYLDEKVRANVINDSLQSFRYGLFYLNHDDTPELWWAEGCSHADGVTVCMYDGTKVVEIGCYGEFGQLRFLPNRGFLISETSGMGAEETAIIGMDEVRPVFVSEYIKNTINVDGTDTVNYSIRGYACDEETYYEQLNSWDIQKDSVQIVAAEGLAVVDMNKDAVKTTYTDMYRAFIQSVKADYYPYGVPTDVLSDLQGVWRADRELLYGSEILLEEDDVKVMWTFNADGTAIYSCAYNNGVEYIHQEFVMEFYPDIIEDQYYIENVWCVLLKDINEKGFNGYISLTKDGNLVEYFVNPEECYEQYIWFHKV